MWNGVKNFIRKAGVFLGIIEEIKQITDHRKINVDEQAYKNIALNKQIYSGYVPAWHHVLYTTSQGVRKSRDRYQLGMGKVLANKMAKLIFNEKVRLNIDDDPGKEFIDDVLEENRFYRKFQRYLEYGYALSGMVVKVFPHNGRVKLSFVTADSFLPLKHDNDEITEGVFISHEKDGDKFYTLLEWHEWDGDLYVITNQLYRSTAKDTLGSIVPLSTLHKDLRPKTVLRGLKRPLFSYFKLNTANNKDLNSPLGVSIFENSYSTLKMIDYMFDFWKREFELGGRKIFVDRSMLKSFHDPESGEHRYVFDSEEEVYVAAQSEDQPATDMSVELRSGDIINSINSLLDILSMQVGFSSGTFNFDGKRVQTATEVVSENSATYQTKNSHEVLVEEGIQSLIQSISQIGGFTGQWNGSDIEVELDFDDSIAESRDDNFAYYSKSASQGLIPKVIAIQRIFKVTEEEALEWLETISDEKRRDLERRVSEEDIDLEGIGLNAVNIRS